MTTEPRRGRGLAAARMPARYFPSLLGASCLRRRERAKPARRPLRRETRGAVGACAAARAAFSERVLRAQGAPASYTRPAA